MKRLIVTGLLAAVLAAGLAVTLVGSASATGQCVGTDCNTQVNCTLTTGSGACLASYCVNPANASQIVSCNTTGLNVQWQTNGTTTGTTCTNVNACNPTCGPGGCVNPIPPPPPVYGCTDPSATNYNSHATVNSGCLYYGCTDPSATNYNSHANYNDNTCTYPIVYGCTDDTASNFNSNATQNDGSCQYPQPTVCCPSPVELPDGQVFVYNGSTYVYQYTVGTVQGATFGTNQSCGSLGLCLLVPNVPLTTQQQLNADGITCLVSPFVIPHSGLMSANSGSHCTSSRGMKSMTLTVTLQESLSRTGPWHAYPPPESWTCFSVNDCSLPSSVVWACGPANDYSYWRAFALVIGRDNENQSKPKDGSSAIIKAWCG